MSYSTIMPWDLVPKGHSKVMPQVSRASSGYVTYVSFENKALIFAETFRKRIERDNEMSIAELISQEFEGNRVAEYKTEEGDINIILLKENLAHAKSFFKLFITGDMILTDASDQKVVAVKEAA